MAAKRNSSPPPRASTNPAWLLEEPNHIVVSPPVTTRPAELPYLDIGWQDFERLCRRLAAVGDLVEATWAYGTPGQKQYGIDILVRRADGTYQVWQTKRYERVRPGDIREAIDIFLKHPWADKAAELVLAYACPLETTGVVDAVEKARNQLKARDLNFVPHDAESLTRELKNQPEIIDDFFGRPWVERICAPEAIDRLRDRLSVVDRNALRQRLRGSYESWIATVDPGLPIANLGRGGRAIPALPLADRFIEPELLVRSRHSDTLSAPLSDHDATAQRYHETVNGDRFPRSMPTSRLTLQPKRERRVPLDSLLSSETNVIITGDAGSGKTTLLRAIALDMLADAPCLPALKDRYHGWLPIWVPFALWARMASNAAIPPSLEAVVAAFFEARGDRELGEALARALESGRVVLLVDGLDEAQDSTALRTMATMLFAYAENRKIPALITSRPHGLTTLGVVPAIWTDVALAPLDDEQRHRLARLWFRVLEAYERDTPTDEAQLDASAATRARAFTDAIGRSSGLATLSSTPLFLLALVGLYRQGKALPTSRLSAIGEIIAQLVEHQPQRRAVDAMATNAPGLPAPRQRDRILDDFAFHLQAATISSQTPDAASVEAAIEKGASLLLARQPDLGLERAETVARDIFAFAEERAGLLAKKSVGEIGFLHLSFQEYLAARNVSHYALADKLAFVRTNAIQPRWREPILYLLHLTKSETEVRDLLAEVRAAPYRDELGRVTRDALVVDAVFADVAHDVPSVSAIAEDLFVELETTAYGRREQHLLGAVTDGLNSEAVGFRCRAKIAEWLPNRHGWGRASALQAMPNWPQQRHADCVPILLRSLYADEEATQRAAAEVLAIISGRDERLKHEIEKRIAHAPTANAVASLLYALGCSWPDDEATGAIAEASRSSADLGIAIEAIRVRAMRGEADEVDFHRYYGHLKERSLHSGLPEPSLAKFFARTQKEMFVRALERDIGNPSQSNPHDLRPLIGAMLICDPTHRLIEPGMLALLKQDWMLRELVGPGGLELSNLQWNSPLVEAMEAHVDKPDAHFRNYDFYWVAKHIRFDKLKSLFVKDLQGKNSFKFWSAKALVEFWGVDDPEVRSALLPFIDAPASELALVAHLLPPLIKDDAACKRAFINALNEPIRRVDLLMSGLRGLGVESSDDIAFEACMAAGARLEPGYRDHDDWQEEMILTFPKRNEVRIMTEAALLQNHGAIGAVATSYASDDAIISRILQVLAPLRENARLALIANLCGSALGNADAVELLKLAREDTSGDVSSEATIGTMQILTDQRAVEPIEIERLQAQLSAVGPDYEAKRVSAAIGLAIAGRFDIAAQELEREQLAVYPITRASLRNDDRYLRRILENWPSLIDVLGNVDAIVGRFSLTAQTVLGTLEPIYPNARLLYDKLMEDIENAPHVNAAALLQTVARFEPASQRLRKLVLTHLLPNRTFDAQAAEIAAGIVAEQFAQDASMHSELLSRLERGREPAAGALAELASDGKHPLIAEALKQYAPGRSHDYVTHYRLMALLATPTAIIADLKQHLPQLDLDALRFQPMIWPNALLRRIREDSELQNVLLEALVAATSPTEILMFAELFKRALGANKRLQEAAAQLLAKESFLVVPSVGIDLTNGAPTLLGHYCSELIA